MEYVKRSEPTKFSVFITNIPYFIVLLVTYYGFPSLIKDTGSGMWILLIVIPVICFFNALVCGYWKGIQPVYLVSSVVLFIPTIFLYYNDSAMIYSLIYGGIALLGLVLGKGIRKLRK